jgi:hypothetical protein
VKAGIGSDGEQIAKRVGDHRQRVRCRVLDVVPVAKRRSARIASWCSAINVKIGSSLSAGNLHSPVSATGTVTAVAAGMLASKQRQNRFVVLVVMESSRRANPPWRIRFEVGTESSRDQRGASQLREGRAAVSACRRGWRRARDRGRVDCQNGPRPPSRTAITAAPGPWPDRRGCRG